MSCTSEHPDYPGLICRGITGHAGDHTSSGYFWPNPAKYFVPAWTGPDSPQGSVKVCGHAVYPEDPDLDVQCELPSEHGGAHCGTMPAPPACDCFRVPHAFYCRTVTRELVPGYIESADGLADAADQRKADAR